MKMSDIADTHFLRALVPRFKLLPSESSPDDSDALEEDDSEDVVYFEEDPEEWDSEEGDAEEWDSEEGDAEEDDAEGTSYFSSESLALFDSIESG